MIKNYNKYWNSVKDQIGEMSEDLKNSVSHRFAALTKILNYLKKPYSLVYLLYPQKALLFYLHLLLFLLL